MKIISIVLLCTLLFTATACGNTSEGGADTAVAATTETLTDTEEIRPDLPDADMEGYEFIILCWHIAFDSEEESGEPINDAIYKRNRMLEGKYNVEIAETVVDTGIFDQTARSAIMAGDTAYDVVVPLLKSAPVFAESSLIVDLNIIPHLDFSKPWWDQRATEQLGIGDKLYFTVGDLNAVDNGVTFCIIFNKDLETELKIEDPYELVRSNQWTMDKFAELNASAAADLNGDSIFDENDRWGLISENYTTYILSVGGGFRITEKGSDNYPVLSMNNEKTVDIYAKSFDINFDTANTIRADTVPGTWDTTGAMFRNSQGLFFSQTLSYFIRLRDMESNIGLLPMPKYDTFQDGYYNYVTKYWSSVMTVPTTNSDLERTGIILEAIAAESMYTLTPAFYDITLATKALRDAESEETLSIILASRAYDIGEIYNWGSTSSIFYNNSRDFASAYAKVEKAVVTAMEKTLEKYKEAE